MSIGLFLMFSKHALRSPEAFVERGFRNFRYFTILSNVYSGLVAVVYIILLICRRKAESGTLMSILKLTSSAAVGVTFTVVLVFLGPLYGYGRMYKNANLRGSQTIINVSYSTARRSILGIYVEKTVTAYGTIIEFK